MAQPDKSLIILSSSVPSSLFFGGGGGITSSKKNIFPNMFIVHLSSATGRNKLEEIYHKNIGQKFTKSAARS